jgi:hypothetical protein
MGFQPYMTRGNSRDFFITEVVSTSYSISSVYNFCVILIHMGAFKSYSKKLRLQMGKLKLPCILEVDSEEKVTKICSYFQMTLIHGCENDARIFTSCTDSIQHMVNADMSVVYAGYGDVSWNNPSMVTPNLEKMAR